MNAKTRRELRIDELTRRRAILFYRNRGKHAYLSNLHPRALFFEGREFQSRERAHQFAKALDPAVAAWIDAAPKEHLVAAIAHALLAFDIRRDWNAIKVDRMQRVVRAYFEQNADHAVLLVGTGDAELVEDSATDAFWGLGRRGDGKNMLGVILMGIREELRAGHSGVQVVGS